MNSALPLRTSLHGFAIAWAMGLGFAACVGGSGTTASSSSESASSTGTETGTSATSGTTENVMVDCTDELPPEGSLCSMEGEECAPDADPCNGYTIATCMEGTWQYSEVGPGDPDVCKPVPCGVEDVPPEGSTCETPGESCAPHKDPCLPYTDAICTDGAWKYTYIGPGDPKECSFPCDPEMLPPEGSACTMEEEFCSPGCEDPCQFCNLLVCQDGAWQGMEVFPDECLSCEEICPAVVMAACFAGPPDQEACVAGCMDAQAGDCGLLHNKMLSCVDTDPFFTCRDDGLPVVEGCEQAFDDYYACLML